MNELQAAKSLGGVKGKRKKLIWNGWPSYLGGFQQPFQQTLVWKKSIPRSTYNGTYNHMGPIGTTDPPLANESDSARNTWTIKKAFMTISLIDVREY